MSSNYARFWKCALQINPWTYAQQYQGTGHMMTEKDYNAALVERCLKNEIQVVGIADHGCVDGVENLRKSLEAEGVIVFPGFEIASTEKVHMVCLYPSETSTATLHQFLGNLEVPTGVKKTAPSSLGGETDVVPLKKIFEDHGNTSPLIAPAHGDMHATNVLVRHGDAILIDFEKLEQDYPLTYDPASLEGGLLVEGFLEDLEMCTLEPKELLQRIEPLYELSALRVNGTSFCRRGDLTEWYYDAVNQIRALSWAAENELGQYALTLALCLIRKGCNVHQDLEAEAPNASRAIAFILGQKILRAIAAKNGSAVGETIAQPEVEK